MRYSHQGKGGSGERGLCYNEITKLTCPKKKKILGPLPQLTYSYFRFVLINEIPDVDLPFLNLKIVMKNDNILVKKCGLNYFKTKMYIKMYINVFAFFIFLI